MKVKEMMVGSVKVEFYDDFYANKSPEQLKADVDASLERIKRLTIAAYMRIKEQEEMAAKKETEVTI